MGKFVALIRGVNVGGNVLKMDRLREVCEELGLKDVQTYLQSGNVVFSGAGKAEKWAKLLEAKLVKEVRLQAAVMCRAAEELQRVRASNPFLKEKGIDCTQLYVTFLAGRVGEKNLALLSAVVGGDDRFIASGTEIYLHCPGGYGRSKLSNNMIERKLGVKATTRNWNTVNHLDDMMIA